MQKNTADSYQRPQRHIYQTKQQALPHRENASRLEPPSSHTSRSVYSYVILMLGYIEIIAQLVLLPQSPFNPLIIYIPSLIAVVDLLRVFLIQRKKKGKVLRILELIVVVVLFSRLPFSPYALYISRAIVLTRIAIPILKKQCK